MRSSAVFLKAPHYVLGEIEQDHATIPQVRARIAELGVLPKAEFWGWGTVRRTERSVESMAVETGSATLRAAAIDPASVGVLVLCSTRFPPDTRDHGRFVENVMTGIGLDGADFVGLTLNRCTNLLAGIQVADALVASGRHRRVLVVSTDRVTDEAARMEKFALFSDGAASCAVTDGQDGCGGFELVSCAAVHNIRELDWSNEISSDLSGRVNEKLLKPLGMSLEDVTGLMHANVFKPIVMLKEMQAGFRPAQLYIDNITRIGHCFAADPIINLVDRAALGQVPDDGFYMLASSVPGSRIGVLLRKVAGAPS
ncbi:MAG TPA: 3-oxoacyl-ACP synthase [Micromonosporaceae bacterium]|nr:3-oxoacyl-ACP synthase [Micromonosporaceae bacterium]